MTQTAVAPKPRARLDAVDGVRGTVGIDDCLEPLVHGQYVGQIRLDRSVQPA